MKINGLFLLIGLIFGSCQDKEPDHRASVIFLNPDDASTLKISDYFDGYQVLTFNDVLCNEISDFVELPDKFLALVQEGRGFPRKTTIYSFNLQGGLMNTVGSIGRGPGEYISGGDEILLSRDSTVIIFDYSKYLNYTSENKLLLEKSYGRENFMIGALGRPAYLWNDTTMLFFKDLFTIEATKSLNNQLKKSLEGVNMLNVYSIPSEKKIHSFFPCEDIFGYKLLNQLYVFQDTLCFYHEKNGYVYDVFQDRVVPRYKIDKGDYSAETTTEEFMNLNGKFRGIAMHCMNETDKYVIGIYYFSNHYYYFWHDKKSHETRNYKLLDDDLLKTGITKSAYFPSNYFRSWHNKMQYPNDYLYFFYSPTEYAEMIKHIQSRLSEKEWGEYKEEHADLIKIYDGLNEDSNTILGLKFK